MILDWFNPITYIIIATAIGTLFTILSPFLKKGGKIKIGDIEFSTNGNGEVDESEVEKTIKILNKDKIFFDRNDIKILITESLSIIKLQYIEDNKILTLQMGLADRMMITLLNRVKEVYQIKLKDLSIDLDNGVYIKDNQLFELLLTTCRNHILQILKSAFLENGYYELSNDNLDAYLKDKIQNLHGDLVSYIRTNYPYSMTISIDEVLTIFDNLEINENVHYTFKNIIINSKSIYVKQKTKINDLDSKLNEVIIEVSNNAK